ncbi:MAG: phosphoglucosamine mutase [Acidimicrobiales bacterium]|nr:phosphoglucosamine mutase [Acidimicrobiales bacterium]
MTLRFGTDGVRGVANSELTPELVLALGRAAARVLVPGGLVLIGRDTRRSGPLLEAALAAGLASEGVAVGRLGVLPTPGVAWHSAAGNVPAAMISASHNPFPDNGIKFFSPGGRKLSDDEEARLEAELDRVLADAAGGERARVGDGVGAVTDVSDPTEGYAAALADSIGGHSLEGVHVVLDGANGAASALAPEVLRRLGARVDVIHDEPDGCNINDGCGSTHPGDLQAAVVRLGAHLGLAFDGDADRVLAVDHAGRLVDGDHLIAMCAIDRAERGVLTDDTVVVTVMTNLGFRLAMAERGIRVVETPVGDRYVLEALDQGGWSLGGEQSGHVIFRDLATTGDGVLTGLQVLDLLARSGRPLAELADAAMVQLPQVLCNVRVAHRRPDVAEAIADEIGAAEAELGERGRVLVRASGTEPLVRVMVEAPTAEQADDVAGRLVAAVEAVCA